jgi:hypothetical protein
MSLQSPPIPSAEALIALECLQHAVAKTLECKRRLGQYAVRWIDNAPVLIGENAPDTALPDDAKPASEG